MIDNYYEWLGLPVDKFECDPIKLKLYVDKFISDCNFNSSTRKQQQGALHQAEMYRVINEPDEWKRIYEDYKNSVDTDIVECFELCEVNYRLTDENISSIASMIKVTETYVYNIAKTCGYIVNSLFTINDLEPQTAIKGTLDGIQSSINQLGFPTLAELILI